MKINPIPEITTTTEIQRNPGLISQIKKDKYHIITKSGKEIAALLDISTFKEILRQANTEFGFGDASKGKQQTTKPEKNSAKKAPEIDKEIAPEAVTETTGTDTEPKPVPSTNQKSEKTPEVAESSQNKTKIPQKQIPQNIILPSSIAKKVNRLNNIIN